MDSRLRISKKKLRAKLTYLHTKLPAQPTAAHGPYCLPEHLRKNVINSSFSQTSLQDISDHIGLYLGLLDSVKVTIGIESSEYMLSTSSDSKKPDSVGLYKVLGGYSREIQLTKQFRFKLEHILAILAHEYTHHYLYHQGLYESDELENEILTEIATAYLGLGHLLIPGYQPIVWTRQSGDTSITYRKTIGYVLPSTIRRAIVASTRLRCWAPNKVLAGLPGQDYLIAYFQLLPYMRQLRKLKRDEEDVARLAKKRAMQLESLSAQVVEIQTSYERFRELLLHASEGTIQPQMPAEDSRRLVEIANKIATRESEHEIMAISERIRMLKGLSSSNDEDVKDISDQINRLLEDLTNWDILISRYIECQPK